MKFWRVFFWDKFYKCGGFGRGMAKSGKVRISAKAAQLIKTVDSSLAYAQGENHSAKSVASRETSTQYALGEISAVVGTVYHDRESYSTSDRAAIAKSAKMAAYKVLGAYGSHLGDDGLRRSYDNIVETANRVVGRRDERIGDDETVDEVLRDIQTQKGLKSKLVASIITIIGGISVLAGLYFVAGSVFTSVPTEVLASPGSSLIDIGVNGILFLILGLALGYVGIKSFKKK